MTDDEKRYELEKKIFRAAIIIWIVVGSVIGYAVTR